MTVRLITLCALLAAIAAGAAAPVDLTTLASGALVALYMAWRRSRWLAD